MATMRAMACILRGSPTAPLSELIENMLCILCRNLMRHLEDETHVMIVCNAYEAFRLVMMAQLRRLWSEGQMAEYEASPDETKRLLLVGKKFQGGESEQMRRSTDTIVKAFLKAVNDWRMEVKGLPDMRGSHRWVPECSLEEAMQCEQDARQAAQEVGEDEE